MTEQILQELLTNIRDLKILKEDLTTKLRGLCPDSTQSHILSERRARVEGMLLAYTNTKDRIIELKEK